MSDDRSPDAGIQQLGNIARVLGQIAKAIASPAPAGAQYLLGAAEGALTAGRVVTDTPSITWDLATAAQAKAKRAALTGDVTASADSNATTLGITTTRGDLIARGAATNGRLGIGTNNQMLSTDGVDPIWRGLSTILDNVIGSTRGMLLVRGGSVWQALAVGVADTYIGSDGTDPSYKAVPYSFRNILVNGGMEIWQRGSGDTASIAVAASTTAYCADRWYLTTGANEASVVAAATGLTNQSQFCAQVQRNNGQTGTTVMTFGYPLTKEECIRLRGKKVTLQFYTATGANWSPTSGTLTYNVYFGTGAEAKRGAGFTGETNPLTGSVNLATGAGAAQTTATSSGTVATTVTQGEVQFTFTPTGTAGAADLVKLDDVQLEPAPIATPFEYLPFGYMMRECQRHYCKTFAYNTAPAQSAGVVGALSATAASATAGTMGIWWQYPVQMRVIPTITTYNPSAANANWRNTTGAADAVVQVDPNTAISQNSVFIKEQTTALVAANNYYIHVQADSGI